MKAVILELLREYCRVEEAFQSESYASHPHTLTPPHPHTPDGYEKGVQKLRVDHSEDMAKVTADIFAHYYIAGRNALAVKLIVSDHTHQLT